MDPPSIAEQVAEQLAPFLGPFNATVAVKTYARRALTLTPDAVTVAHVPILLEAMRPMLCTLVGRASTDVLVERIRQGVK